VILETGKWRFKEEDVERLVGIVRKRKVILYARVSSNKQKDDLINQVKYLEENVKDYDQVITDVGSGLNMKRKGFLKLLRMILNNEVSKIVIAYPDRLVRFGFEIIEEVCKAHNCEIVVLNKEDKTPEQELIEDLISILVSFSGKLYETRSHKYEKVKKCVEELKA
jgi:predicted site-specific integrase-resolvase